VDAWNETWRLNQTLPEHLRQSMEYPLLPLWIEVDPTEAVHSELIVETLYRYWVIQARPRQRLLGQTRWQTYWLPNRRPELPGC
jgi:hypothetical protein